MHADEVKANPDMIEGFMDGYDPNCPAPSSNRSHSYRHGFMCGRADITKKNLGSIEDIIAAADRAMQLDCQSE